MNRSSRIGAIVIAAVLLITALTACGAAGKPAAGPSELPQTPSAQEQTPEIVATAPEAVPDAQTPEDTAPTTEEPASVKDLSVDEISVFNVQYSAGIIPSAVFTFSNPSTGVTYHNVKATVSFYDADGNLIETVKPRLEISIRPGEQVPFRTDCKEGHTAEAERAEVVIDSFDLLDAEKLEKYINSDGENVYLIDDGSTFELVNHKISKKSSGTMLVEFTVRNNSSEKEECNLFVLFRNNGQIVYGEPIKLWVDGSASKDDYFYPVFEYDDFPAYDEVEFVLIKKN